MLGRRMDWATSSCVISMWPVLIRNSAPDNRPQCHSLDQSCDPGRAGIGVKLRSTGPIIRQSDGTCIRDFIHVSDLAKAHVSALDYLDQGGQSLTLNCGYGRGFSVREVVTAVEEVIGRPLPLAPEERRAGDAAEVVASVRRIRSTLDWQPAFEDLRAIVAHSLARQTSWVIPRQRTSQTCSDASTSNGGGRRRAHPTGFGGPARPNRTAGGEQPLPAFLRETVLT